MSDDIIVGILGIAAAIVGTFTGFAISKISDSITATRERKRYQILLRLKLATITVMINTIISRVNLCDKITDQDSFTIIEDLLRENDIKEEISKLESLNEKVIKFNFDEKENEYLVKLMHLKFGVNHLLYSGTIHAKEPIPDEKPHLMKLLTGIYEDLDYLSSYHSQEFQKNRFCAFKDFLLNLIKKKSSTSGLKFLVGLTISLTYYFRNIDPQNWGSFRLSLLFPG